MLASIKCQQLQILMIDDKKSHVYQVRNKDLHLEKPNTEHIKCVNITLFIEYCL